MKFSRANETGYALIIVLWAVVILSIIFVNLADEVHLNSVLVKNNLDESKLQQVAVSGVMKGINQLKVDKTEYDTKKDQWTKEIEDQLDNLKYKVEIKDVGSRLNINYSRYEILSELNWWDEELEKRLVEEGLIPDLKLLKDDLGDNYNDTVELLTTYGEFNLNNDRLQALRKLLELNNIDKFESELILDYLQKKRNKDEIIKKVDELQTLYLKGLRTSTLEKLKPYLATQGRLNINFVSEEILELILKSLKNNSSSKEEIISFRKENEIKKLSQLKFLGKELSRYFTVSSHYFLIKATVFSSSNKRLKEIKSIVKRTRIEDGDWQVKILKWSEE